MSTIETFTYFIGEECLIIKFKSQLFYNLIDLDINDFTLCFNELKRIPIMSDSNHNLKQNNINFLFVIIYNLYDSSNQEVVNYFLTNFLNNKNKMNLNRKEQLFYIFNQIEFDMKYKIYSKEEYKSFLIELNKFVNYSKSQELELLYQYYLAYVNLILHNEEVTNRCYMNVILDITECDEGNKPFSFIKYMDIRNRLLGIKKLEVFEQNDNKRELMQNVDSLFKMVVPIKIEFALKLGLKLYLIQNDLGEYNQCIQTLEYLLTLINHQKLIGKNQTCLTELSIYIYVLLGYYNSLLRKHKEVARFTKKIDKLKPLLELSNSKNLQSNNESLIAECSLHSIILGNISGSQKPGNENLRNSMNKYKKYFRNYLTDNDDVIMDLYFLDQNNQEISKSFNTKYLEYESILENKINISTDKLLSFYVHLFNMLSIINKHKHKDYIINIRNKSKMIMQYSLQTLNAQHNKNVSELFNLPIFKEVLFKIFFSYLFTFYHTKEYNIIINECNDFFPLFYRFELNDLNCACIYKLKGDALYKLQKYNEAYATYEEAIKYDNKSSTIWFNMALCKLIKTGNKKDVMNLLQRAKSCTEDNQQLGVFTSLENKINSI